MLLPTAVAVAGSLRWDPAVDLPLTVAAGGTSLILVTQVEPALTPGARAVPSTGFDALARDEVVPGIATASDYVATGSVALALGVTAAGGVLGADVPMARVAVWTEAFAFDALATETLKTAVRRPRPYTLSVELAEVDDDLSFPSGHTSYTAVAAFAAARELELGGARPAVCVAAYSAATALTATVATMRVAAGKHYPSDVVAGALLGGAIGLVVPTLHHVGVAPIPGGVAVTGRL